MKKKGKNQIYQGGTDLVPWILWLYYRMEVLNKKVGKY